jgi:hypothetical protein
MATPADQRLLELLDKWLKSLELHRRYASLDDDSYAQVQPWPEHQRPSQWIIDLAKQKAVALRDQIDERIKAGDTKFSDSLELMTFLANLVGAEHIERFIPLANADTEHPLQPASADARVQNPSADSATGTREMPKFVASKARAPAPAGTQHVARTERKATEVKAAPKPAAKPAPKPTLQSRSVPARPAVAPADAHGAAASSKPASRQPAADGATASEAGREQVIADAVRLVQWGRKWYELAELISGMAGRPSLTEVRRILKDHKMAIEKKAGKG